MSDKSTIYEITKLMENKDALQNDLNEVVTMVKDVFYQKYIQKFQTALDEQKNLTKKQSSKEVQLLTAIKPFMNKNSHESIDEIINIMYTLNTAQSIDKEIKKCSNNTIYSTCTNNVVHATSSPIHDDGIYEIDENCKKSDFTDSSINMTELIFMLLLGGVIS